MLTHLQSLISSSRKLRGSAVRKWEEFEGHAVELFVISVVVLISLIFLSMFAAQLMLIGVGIGFLICVAYYFMLVAKVTAASIASISAALAAAVVVGIYGTFPLWFIFFNSVSGVCLVISLVAVWTRRY